MSQGWWTRRRALIGAGAWAGGAGLLTAAGARAQTPSRGPAYAWRFFRGEGVEGAMKLIGDGAPLEGAAGFGGGKAAVGHFVLNVKGKGFFIGLYNIRENGRSVVGTFWPEGAKETDPIAGTLDIGAAPDATIGAAEARVRFLDGAEYSGLKVE